MDPHHIFSLYNNNGGDIMKEAFLFATQMTVFDKDKVCTRTITIYDDGSYEVE